MIDDLAKDAEGFLLLREGRFLYEAAKACPGKGVIVEIGSFKGKSTIWLAKGSLAGKGIKIFAVDPHSGSPEERKLFGNELWTFDVFRNNITNAGVDEVVVPIVKTSEEAARGWTEKIELIWIDGDHSYKMVKKDFECWFPHLVEGGIIAFHDATNPYFGVKKFLDDFVINSNDFASFGLVDGIIYARKGPGPKLAAAFSRIKLKILLSLIFFYRKIPLPKNVKSKLKVAVKFLLRK